MSDSGGEIWLVVAGVLIALVLVGTASGIWDSAYKAGRAHCMTHPQDSDCQALLEKK